MADQRHGLDTARKLAGQRPEDGELIRAGLLHDIGKSQSGYGPLGRTLATLASIFGVPMTARQKSYIAHGAIGAAALGEADVAGLVVEFARHHPGPPPEGVDEDRWAMLLKADGD